MNSKYKTSMCRHFQEKGYCSMKDRCHFAHGQSQLRSPDDPLPHNISVQLKPVSIYKTQLCKYYAQGYCKNSDQCTYAHGEADMRSMPVIPVGQTKQVPRIAPNCPPPMYPMYMMPMPVMVPIMPVPAMNANTANLLTILYNLYQVFPNNQSVYKQLRMAQQYVMSGQPERAKQIIDQIFSDDSRTLAEKEKQKKIVSSMVYLNSLNSLRSPFITSNFDI